MCNNVDLRFVLIGNDYSAVFEGSKSLEEQAPMVLKFGQIVC